MKIKAKITLALPPAIENKRKTIEMAIEDAYVVKVDGRSGKWAVGELWARVASWYEKKGAIIEEKEI